MCFHYLPMLPDKSQGVCRRYPPTVHITKAPSILENGEPDMKSGIFTSQFSPVASHLSCGEFKPLAG